MLRECYEKSKFYLLHTAGPHSGYVIFLEAEDNLTQQIGPGGEHKFRTAPGLLTKSATSPRILDILCAS